MGNNVETVIGASVKVEGNFIGEGDVVIEGVVIGTIKTAKNLQIGAAAKVQADIEADNVTVSGEIRGNVTCRGRLIMSATAKIFGNVRASVISVSEGAILHGKCSMVNGKEGDATVNNQQNGGDDRIGLRLKR